MGSQYFNINGVSYLFSDRGALYFDEFDGVTMIYNLNTIKNVLCGKMSLCELNYFGPDYLCFSSCGSGGVGAGRNDVASCFFEKELSGAVLVLHKDLYEKVMKS